MRSSSSRGCPWGLVPFLLFPTLAAAEPATVSGTGVRVRVAPDAKADVLSTLPAGTPVERTGEEEGGFCAVEFAGAKGWVACKYLSNDAAPSRRARRADPGEASPKRNRTRHPAESDNSEPQDGSVTPRHGFFFDGAIGEASGNFTLTGDSHGDTGTAFRLALGGAFRNGFGLGASVSGVSFEYKSKLTDTPMAAMSFALVGLDLWYFINLSTSWELDLRGTIGDTAGSMQVGVLSQDGSGAGESLGLGLAYYLTDHFAVDLDLNVTHYGVAFLLQEIQSKQDEVTTEGIALGLRYR